MSVIEKISFDQSGLLRFITAGSVDDGKSTLIGRLLYDSKSISEDQLTSISNTTRKRGMEGVDLSSLTDGLQTEREQGITLDVTCRYFATPKRNLSLPIHRAMSNIRAIWSSVHRPPIWRLF